MRIDEALERFLARLEADGRSPHTILQYRRHVSTLARWCREVGHTGEVSALSDDDVGRFLSSPQARTSARGGQKRASSIACLKRSVQAFLRAVRGPPDETEARSASAPRRLRVSFSTAST